MRTQTPLADTALTLLRLQSADTRVSVTGTRRKCAKLAVLFTLILLLALHFGLAEAAEKSHRLRDPAFGDKLLKLQRISRDKPCVVMLGSSRTLLGFHGEVAEQTLGEGASVFNFGIPATGPITQLVYIKRMLAAGVRPKLLLLEVLPSTLHDTPGGPAEMPFLPGDRLTGDECDLVAKYGFDSAKVEQEHHDVQRAPWIALRFRILARVVPSWVPENERCDWSRTTDARGWTTPPLQEVDAEHRARLEAKARGEYGEALANLQPEGRPLQALRDTIQLCEAEGIAVQIVLMPEDSKFRGMYSPESERRLMRGVSSLDAPLVNAREWIPDDEMYDGHHMFARGAKRFTERLTREAILPHFPNTKARD